MENRKITCAEANRIDLVDFLSFFGCTPSKIKDQEYWYLSPLRTERTPSFKINRKLNLWYDHGIGKGGTVIDLGVMYFNCSVADFLKKLAEIPAQTFSFQPQNTLTTNNEQAADEKIQIIECRPIHSKLLINYLNDRRVPVELANCYCKEVDFRLRGNLHTAIGFQNNSGGYELRNQYFKGSSSPKDVRLIDNRTEKLHVFEGFFSFLSYMQLSNNKKTGKLNLPEQQDSYLILNSLSFLQKSLKITESFSTVNLYLDRDKAGLKATKEALTLDKRLKDRSEFYNGFKDLNDLLTGAKMRESNRLRL